MPRKSKPWYREASGTWVSRVNGRLVTLAHGKDAEAEAFVELVKVKKEGRRREREVVHSLGELSEEYLKGVEKSHSYESFDSYRRFIRRFADVTGAGLSIKEVNGSHVRRWIDSRPWNQSTRFLGLSVVKSFFNWCITGGFLASSPAGKIRADGILRREKIPTREELSRLKEKAPSDLKVFITALEETGARPSELVNANVEHVHGDRITMARHKRAKKVKRPRVIFLNAVALQIVQELAAGRAGGEPLFPNHEGKRIKRRTLLHRVLTARKRAGLGAHVTLYGIRHLWITSNLAKGAPVAVVAELAGTSVQMIDQHYGHLEDRADTLRAWANRSF